MALEISARNQIAITVLEDYDDAADKACDACNFFADDSLRIASIDKRTSATVRCGLFSHVSKPLPRTFRKPPTNWESDALTLRAIDLSPLRPPPRSWASFDPLREYAGEMTLIGKARGQRDLA